MKTFRVLLWADAESTLIYNGIEMRRTVFTTEFGIVDLHVCRSDQLYQYDWMFHYFGEAKPEALTLRPEEDTSVTLFAIPMNENGGSEIDYLMLSRNAKSTVFATVQEPWWASTASKVRENLRMHVRAIGKQVPDHEATALHVKLIDGTRRIFFVNCSSGEKLSAKSPPTPMSPLGKLPRTAPLKTQSKGALLKMR